MTAGASPVLTTPRRGFGPMPIPHEHGAWVMLYAPMLSAFLALRGAHESSPLGFLFLAVTGAFLARHSAALWLRRRGKVQGANAANLPVWTAFFTFLLLAGGVPLLALHGRWQLLFVAPIAGVCFAFHALLQNLPARKRLDRSQWGEVFGACALCLTGPAAVIALGGAWNQTAWLLWAACALFFAGGVTHVKMLLGAAPFKKQGLDAKTKFRIAGDNLALHIVMLVVAFFWALEVAQPLILLAFAPLPLRAFWGIGKLSPQLPSLKRVGMVETVYALWFAVWIGFALR
jgi:hypothetical protein